MIADRPSLAADGQDVIHLTVRILDAEGVFCPAADNRVVFEVEGEGRLIGVENGDPIDHDSYKADNRRAFAGMCLAIVQATRRAGEIHVRAASDDLQAATVRLASNGLR